MTHGSTIRGGRLLRAALVICLALIVVITQAALVSAAGTPGLADLADLFPGADSIDPANGQEPRAVLRAGNVVGWV
ncbi:MAG: hypothetical protein NT133_18465, partial [Alphaproteobacteria bacterium]|nr:hypothetical protein [Alphaproteobacteria bacterium]